MNKQDIKSVNVTVKLNLFFNAVCETALLDTANDQDTIDNNSSLSKARNELFDSIVVALGDVDSELHMLVYDVFFLAISFEFIEFTELKRELTDMINSKLIAKINQLHHDAFSEPKFIY